MVNTETVNSFENSSNSISIYEESNSRLNFNNAMLIDEISSDSDENFYDTMNGDTSIAIKQNENENISNTSEHYDSTSFFSLPNTKSYANCKTKNPINVNNSQRDVDAEEKDNTTNTHVSIKAQLRQMLDEVLGKPDSAKQTNETDSTRNLNNEFLSSNSNLTDRSDSTFETNSNSMCQTEKFHNIIRTSTEDANDLRKINASSSRTYRLNSERLITVLENSNESSSDSQQTESNNWSGKYIGKLKNFFSWKLNNKCINKKIFTTSEISDNTSTSSDTSTEIEMLSKEIFQKIKDLRANESPNVDINFQFRNETIIVESTNRINLVKNEANSTSAKYEEPVCPDTVFPSLKIEMKKLKNNNRIGKKTAKRRSLSMSENDTEEKEDQDNNNKKNNKKSKTPQRMGFFDRTNFYERSSVSPNIIASPIKPVTYLRKIFMDMEKKNKVRSVKQSPIHKLRQTKVPFISVTPATPEHLK